MLDYGVNICIYVRKYANIRYLEQTLQRDYSEDVCLDYLHVQIGRPKVFGDFVNGVFMT